jgi:ATP-dependent protease HslVU (ClpYQ) ATPase subunit
VIGQEVYKKRLTIAAAYHFAMIKYLNEHPDDKSVKRFRKKNTLMVGPSGSGKTYCIEVLRDLLQVPTLIVDATDYTEAGYVGKSADDMIRELIDLPQGLSIENTKKSPFVDYVEYFKNEYGIELVLDEDVQNYFEQYASDHNIQISEALKNLLHGASALNYMGIIEPFRVAK